MKVGVAFQEEEDGGKQLVLCLSLPQTSQLQRDTARRLHPDENIPCTWYSIALGDQSFFPKMISNMGRLGRVILIDTNYKITE
jgi:hypothetical protein